MNMDHVAPRACFIVEPLMIDFTSVPATQNPSRPKIVCTTTMAVVTAATDGGLLSALRECAMYGASVQNGINHKRMSSTPTLRRNRDTPADSGLSVVDVPWRMLIPDSVRWGLARALRPHASISGCCGAGSSKPRLSSLSARPAPSEAYSHGTVESLVLAWPRKLLPASTASLGDSRRMQTAAALSGCCARKSR